MHPLIKAYNYQIFFNPYTAKVVGVRDYYATFGHYIRHIHVRLYNGILGRFFVGFGGLALLISTITGLLIYGGFMKRQFFGAIRNKNLRIKSADYHKVIGMSTLLFNLMIAITGAWLGLQALLQPILQVKSPEVYKRVEKPISDEEDLAYYVDCVKAFETARELFPDLTPKSMAYSADGSRMVFIRGDVPKTAYETRISYIVLDKQDYSELARYDVRKGSLGDKVYYAQEGLHYGDFGGIWGKLIYSFFGLTSGVLALLGFVLYLERTKSKKTDQVNAKPTGRKVWLWSLGITAVCVLLYVMTVVFGMNLPTLIITILAYGTILYYLFKPLVLFVVRKLKALFKKRANY